MGVFTDAGKNVLLDTIDGSGWYAAPFDGDPAGGGTEQSSDTTEGRIILDSKMGSAASGTVSNSTAILWTATATITVDYIAIFDAASGGNLVASDDVSSQTVNDTETLSIPIGDLDFILANP